jgi:Na+-driven multidrug efflux pump
MVEWGIAVGVVLGVLVVLARPLFLPLFTSDSAVTVAALPALVIVALSQPVSGIVFVLDGVLMGAGDGPYLAWAMLITLAVFTPVALLVPTLGGGLTALWAAMTLMMLVRMVTLWLRSRSGRWLVTGATR